MAKARGRSSRRSRQTDVKDYRHDETRKNNPPAGLATYERKRVAEKRYEYDPHLDPQLVWAGKAEHTSFEVPTVSLDIHERVSTSAIVRAVQREEPKQLSLFADPQFPLDQAIEFYQHDMDWANRLVLGPPYQDNGLVFATALGTPVDPANLRRAWGRMVKAAGLDGLRFHDLRHAHATLMLQQGVHPKVVSERLGHSGIRIMMDTYSHVMPGLQARAAAQLDGLFKGVVSEFG